MKITLYKRENNIRMKRNLIKILLNFSILLVLTVQSLSAQELITGRVFDNAGQSVQNALILLVDNPDKKITTDVNGIFSFTANEGDRFYIEIDNLKEIFTLKKTGAFYKLKNYTCKINTGYGYSVKNKRVTGAVSTVNSSMLNKFTVVKPENALYGQLPGLFVLQNGGTPWNRTPDMYIRGLGTLNNNSILVIVDGFERPLSSLTLDEIETVSVLKDAAALARFGQKGANGVLVINTKRGEYNTFKVDASYQYGFNSAFRMPLFLDAYHYARSVNEASALDGNQFIYSEWDLNDFQTSNNPYLYPDVNWIDETFDNRAVNTNFDAQFRGGGKNVKYFSLINYQTEKGLFNYTNYDSRYNSQLKYTRFNIRTNIDANITSTTSLTVNVGAGMGDYKYPGAGVYNIMNALYSIPSAAFPVKTHNNNWGGSDLYSTNPVAMIASTGYRQDFSRQLLANVRLIQDLSSWIDGLSLELASSFDNSAVYQEGKIKSYEYEDIDVIRDENTGLITDTIVSLYGTESDLNNYDPGHNKLSQWRHAALWSKINYEKKWDNSSLFTSLIYNMDKYVTNGQYHTYLHQNYTGIANYEYKKKYFADVTMSYSGSSNLPEGNRFGLFPALSAGWLMSSEDFLKNKNFINKLKLRGSWGLSGNDRMAPNLNDQQFHTGGRYFFTNNYNGQTGITPGRMATTNLTSERASIFNVGIDAVLFNKLFFNIDAFYEKRSNILVSTNQVISGIIGVVPPIENMGIVENRGFDTDLMWKDNIGKFSYYAGGTFSFAKNKIIEMNEEFRPYDYLKRTGLPVGQMFGLEAIGFFNDESDISDSPQQLFSKIKPGDIKYADKNNDGVINAYDEVAIGYAGVCPEIYYSGKIGFEIAGFGIDALFQGIAHQSLYLNTPGIFWPLRNNKTISDFSANRWTPSNTNEATLPRLTLLSNDNNYRKNTIWLQDGDYFKLRTLDVHYNIPEKLMNKVKLKNGKIFAKGMNLFSIDKIKNVDPEAIGISYPTLRSYHLGIMIGF